MTTTPRLFACLLAAPACCVAGSTPIRTPRGERAAGVLEVGEVVLSVEVATGRLVESTIVAVRRAVRECLALRWAGGALVCTPEHPLFDPRRGAYRPASDWLTGDATRLLCAGEVVEEVAVAATEVFAGVHEVVDLCLSAGPHNFIAAGVVVHNKSLVIPYDPPVQVAERIDGPAFELTGDGAARAFRLRACIDDEDVWGDATIEVEVVVVATTTAQFEAGGGPSLSLQADFATDEPEIGEVPTTLYLRGDAPGGSCVDGVGLAFLQFDGPKDAVVALTWEAQVIAYHEQEAEGRLVVTIEPGE